MQHEGTGAAELYASPVAVDDLADCCFYHTMEVPGHGLVEGQWDLRPGVQKYLGGVDFTGKRVLDLGAADGYLSFEMERRGAQVVSYDLGPDDPWDIVPFARLGLADRSTPSPSAPPSWVDRPDVEFADQMRRLHNAYWLCHRAFGSRARLVHGNVYSVPPEIGPVDISVFGAILLHTQDPFGAMRSALALTAETVVVTDALGWFAMPEPLRKIRKLLPRRLRRPMMRFLPDWRTGRGADGWWRLSPEVVQAFVGVLGFERSTVSTHLQLYKGRPWRLFTVVAHRT